MEYRKGRHVVSALHVHLVFVTKYRRGALDDDAPSRLGSGPRPISPQAAAGADRDRAKIYRQPKVGDMNRLLSLPALKDGASGRFGDLTLT